MSDITSIESNYIAARDKYAEIGVDADSVLAELKRISLSLHCWQGDDCGGFENAGSAPGGGLALTGNHPGKARTPDELRLDLRTALSMIPGSHRANIHAFYAETGGKKVDRDELLPEHFYSWIDWAKETGVGLDFNPTFFSHPKASDGFTLSHHDRGVRDFWVEHGIACRRIGEEFGMELGTPCVTNFWIPDGFKDMPADRKAPRERLKKSLDEIFNVKVDEKLNVDSLESKLFGIGSECYVVGSHEFYLGYAIKNDKLICLDTGHFHPTESVSDKITAVMPWIKGVLLHISRGVRWDSDHVVILSDELKSIAEEVVRGGYLDRIRIGMDYFDASINRIAAWIIGARNMLKALLIAFLEPTEILRNLEKEGDFTARLALLEEIKTFPAGTVWDYYCLKSNTPPGRAWLDEVKKYEREELFKRV